MKTTASLHLGVALAGAVTALAAQPANRPATDALVITNLADTPVRAAAITLPATRLTGALNLPAGTPLRATTTEGREVLILPGIDNGAAVVRAYVSLPASGQLPLRFEKSPDWTAPARVCRAQFDASTGTGTLGNGVVALTFRQGTWSLAFAGPMLAPASDRPLLVDCALDAWLDPERRGRLMSIDPRSLGLIHTPDARLVDGTATVGPDGSATLKLTRRFDGFAEKILWTETYTLPPGQPVVHYRTRFENQGAEARYLAYVEHGGGLRGRFGPLLRQEPLLKYDNPTTPAGVLLSGPSNSFTRISWRRERCWVGVGSGLGCGIGIATADNVTRELLGSTVWAIGATGFTTCLLDPEQGNFPYVIRPGGAVDTGLSFVATSGGTHIWHQTREFFAATTAGRTSPISSSCSVHFGGEPWQAGEVSQYQVIGDATTNPPPALAIDFQRAYRLTATAADLPAGGAIQIAARPLGDTAAPPVPLLTLDRAGAQAVDFTARTGWAGRRQAFVLSVTPSAAARLAKLELAPAPITAPGLSSPAGWRSIPTAPALRSSSRSRPKSRSSPSRPSACAISASSPRRCPPTSGRTRRSTSGTSSTSSRCSPLCTAPDSRCSCARTIRRR